jgi:hypothetical protein
MAPAVVMHKMQAGAAASKTGQKYCLPQNEPLKGLILLLVVVCDGVRICVCLVVSDEAAHPWTIHLVRPVPPEGQSHPQVS